MRSGALHSVCKDFINLLAKMGNRGAIELQKTKITIVDGTAFVPFGNARQPGESDTELRKRLNR